MITAFTVSSQRSSEVEPIVDVLMGRVAEVPFPTYGNLIQEMTHLLGQSVIKQKLEAKDLLERKIEQIAWRNGMEPLGFEGQRFYNLSQNLIDSDGTVSEWSLKRLKMIELGSPPADEEAFERYCVKVTETHFFKKIKGFLSSYNYHSSVVEILKMPSLYSFRAFLEQEIEQNHLLPLAQVLVKEDKIRGKKITESYFPPFENPPPKMAFGKKEWEKYFGEVGEEPPLPLEMNEILESPCPYWEGKRVEETHLLVLIPEKINGVPFTLNLLQEIIQSPKGEGYVAYYNYYYDLTRNEVGIQIIDSSYWILVTKNILPNSTNKTYSQQQALVKRLYTIPKVLELATMILMHHVRSKEKLLTKEYSRCIDVPSNGYRGLVGVFQASALTGNHTYNNDDYIQHNIGITTIRYI